MTEDGGEVVAFELLVRRHAGAVWRVAAALLRDDFAAEAAVRDTFLEAYATFRDEAAVRTWLVRICTRVCLARMEPAREVPASAHLGDAVGALAVEERAAFVLVDVLGHRVADAADLTGVAERELRTLLAQARQRLALVFA